MENLKIIIVDDNIQFRTALKKMLETKYNANIIAEASNGAEFRQFTNLRKADIILMDVMMPDFDGITLTKEALWKDPALKFIAITLHYDKVYLDTLLGAGFKGCVFKSNIFVELDQALHAVMDNKLYYPEDIIVRGKG